MPNIKILKLCGGTPFGPQKGSLEHGAHIIVGTPGRVEEHLRKGNFNFDNMRSFVLDEADRMLDMGFQAALDAITKFLPRKRQTLLFSATFPPQIKLVANNTLTNPVTVTIDTSHEKQNIKQLFFTLNMPPNRKEAALTILLKYRPETSLVFCNTKKETQEIADFLAENKLVCLALHGDMEQKSRDETLVQFANKSTSILVATDVAARGLDIDSLDLVINVHMAHDPEVHIHRIGRTGRNGNKGLACTFFEDNEKYKLEGIESQLGEPVQILKIPSPSSSIQGFKPRMQSLQIDAGKKNKIRPTDILGALTGGDGINGADVGKITILDYRTYVAVKRECAKRALKKLSQGKIKGRFFKVRSIRN